MAPVKHDRMSVSRRRRAERDAAAYAWRTSGARQTVVLERIGHSSWVPELLVLLLAFAALLWVATSWLVPAIAAGMTTGWDAILDVGPARAASLSGPAWMYAVFGVVFLAIAVSGVPYIVSETRKHRRPYPILTLAPGYVIVHTVRDVAHGTAAAKPRLREAEAVLEWHDLEGVESSRDPGDERPVLVVRGPAAERLGLPVDGRDGGDGRGTAVRVRIRGDARDVPVLAHFAAGGRRAGQLGSDDSLNLARRLSASPPAR